jgi:hypothetical protein
VFPNRSPLLHPRARAGTIEIVADVHLIKTGDKVGASEAALLGKLGIKPFKYGLEVVKVYDSGSLFEPAVLEITGEAQETGCTRDNARAVKACVDTSYFCYAPCVHVGMQPTADVDMPANVPHSLTCVSCCLRCPLSPADEDMQASVGAALANIAALSLATDYPTLASLPHSVINGYKNVLAIAVETDYTFPLAEKVRAGSLRVLETQDWATLLCGGMCGCGWCHVAAAICVGVCSATIKGRGGVIHVSASRPPLSSKHKTQDTKQCLYSNTVSSSPCSPNHVLLCTVQVKAYLADPSAFAVAAAPAAGGSAAPAAAAAAPEPEEEEEEDMGFSLFD